MGNSNRRKHPRANTNLLVSETIGGRYFLPMLTNISEQGIYIECPSGLEKPPGHDSIVEISLPGIKQMVWARCRALRRERLGFFQGQAMRFVDISAFDRQQIRSYIQHNRAV